MATTATIDDGFIKDVIPMCRDFFFSIFSKLR